MKNFFSNNTKRSFLVTMLSIGLLSASLSVNADGVSVNFKLNNSSNNEVRIDNVRLVNGWTLSPKLDGLTIEAKDPSSHSFVWTQTDGFGGGYLGFNFVASGETVGEVIYYDVDFPGQYGFDCDTDTNNLGISIYYSGDFFDGATFMVVPKSVVPAGYTSCMSPSQFAEAKKELMEKIRKKK